MAIEDFYRGRPVKNAAGPLETRTSKRATKAKVHQRAISARRDASISYLTTWHGTAKWVGEQGLYRTPHEEAPRGRGRHEQVYQAKLTKGPRTRGMPYSHHLIAPRTTAQRT